MLSVGGDAAVARGSVACSVPASDILIMGTLKQILALVRKIEKQPFGLNLIARNILEILKNISKNEFVLKTSRREINLGQENPDHGYFKCYARFIFRWRALLLSAKSY